MVMLLFIFLSMFFWASAAFFNAVMDTLAHHYYNSIFNDKKFDSVFYNPALSDKSYVVPCTKYKCDAWHLSKSSMIICQALSCCFTFLAGVQMIPDTSVWIIGIDVSVLMIVLGIVWNGTFNLFYNKVLIKKQK